MPRVLKHTPAWLSRPSTGHKLFAPTSDSKPSLDGKDQAGPLRTIANRGTEVFVAVGKELRWSDLILVKETWEDEHGSPAKPLYRVLKVPISRKIKQLIVSPSGDYLAILTTHTIHVAVLPDPSHLASEDNSPLKLKTYHVGPTTHVLETSLLASALWHPLGQNGNCLVTITRDAVVRMWELNRDNKWSFDAPALAVDLRKLANGTSPSQDFSPSKYGISNGYSPDSFEMEVSSACFGGRGIETETPWAAMTLWVAMQAGDVYALCPFVPSKWDGSATLLQDLASSVAGRSEALDFAESVQKRANQIFNQQNTWLSELAQSAQALTADDHFTEHRLTFQRPTRPGPIAKLQGPFQLTPDRDDVFDITDIAAFAASNPISSFDDGLAPDEGDGSPIGLVGIATGDGIVRVCADLDGVEGRWLQPSQNFTASSYDDDEPYPELLLVDVVQVYETNDESWPVFTADIEVGTTLFLTHPFGVTKLDCAPWAQKLRAEVSGEAESGIDFRLNLALENGTSSFDRVINLGKQTDGSMTKVSLDSQGASVQVPACVALLDSDLGYFVITAADNEPQAVTLEDEVGVQKLLTDGIADDLEDAEMKGLLPAAEERAGFQPPKELYFESSLPPFFEQHLNSRGKQALSDNVKLSPAMLNILTDAHRLLSEETLKLGSGASNIFVQCERLQKELEQQVGQVKDAAQRIDVVTGEDVEDDELSAAAERIDQRIENIMSRSSELAERYTELRNKLSRVNRRPLGEKEIAWQSEIDDMAEALGDEKQSSKAGSAAPAAEIQERFGEIKDLKSELIEQYEEHTTSSEVANGTNELEEMLNNSRNVDTVDALLERQTALIEATRIKLERLSTMSQ